MAPHASSGTGDFGPRRGAHSHRIHAADHARDQPADVPADRDAGDGEREHEVDQDQRADAGLERVDATRPHGHERGPHQAEHRSRGADRDRVVVEDQRQERAAEQRHHVEHAEPPPLHRGFEQHPQLIQQEHVEPDVEQVGVQEAAGDGPPPVARRHGRAVERAVGADLVHPAEGEVEHRLDLHLGRHQVRHEHGDVGRDQGERHHGPGHERAGGDDLLAAAAGALGAMEPDRSLVHARRADGPVTALADHAGAPVGVPVAGLHVGGGHGRSGYRRVGGSSSRRRPLRARS